jgi:hypothetical protein
MPQTDWGQTWAEYHVYSDRCNHQVWCRLHWWPGFDGMGAPIHLAYPFEVMVKSSRHGWQEVTVFCGPGAYLPKRGKR